MCRFSDDELQHFYQEFQQHVLDEEAYRGKNDQILHRVLEATEANTSAISEQIDETRAIVQIYRDLTASKRLLAGLGRFARWIASMAIFVAIYHFFMGQK